MKLARLGPLGSETPVAIVGDRYLDLSSVVDATDGEALAPDSLARIRDAVTSGHLPPLRGAADLRIGSPVTRPSALICIGMNYAAHAAESGSVPPELPILFPKTPNTIGGPNDGVDIPRKSLKTDWEVELGLVIGTRALYLESPDAAADHIAGYLTADAVQEYSYPDGTYWLLANGAADPAEQGDPLLHALR